MMNMMLRPALLKLARLFRQKADYRLQNAMDERRDGQHQLAERSNLLYALLSDIADVLRAFAEG